MDKASIIKDAIEYIQQLHDQEKIIQAEIMELESGMLKKNPSYDFEPELPVLLKSKKKRTEQQLYDSVNSRNSPIEILEVNPMILFVIIIGIFVKEYFDIAYKYGLITLTSLEVQCNYTRHPSVYK